DRIAGLFAAGALGIIVGSIWHWVFPINKSLWTSSYVVFTAGVACVTLATCMWLVDLLEVRRWARPLVIFGVNPLLAFVGSGMMARLIYGLLRVHAADGSNPSVQSIVYRRLFASWLAPRNASLLFALAFVLFWLGLLWLLHRRNIILKL